MNKRIEWLRPGLPAGATIFALLLIAAGTRLAHAEDNFVRVDPSGAEVAPGGSFHVAVIDDPPEQSVAAWVIKLTFDPDVVTTTNPDCVSKVSAGGAAAAFDCEVIDDNGDGKDDTITMLGALLFSRSQKGLVNETKLDDITFHAVGAPGSCSDLKLRILIHADAEGEETAARVQDGRACVQSDAPPTGTASPFSVTPRTSEPTPVGGASLPTIRPAGETGGATQSSPGDSGGSTSPSRSRTTSAGGQSAQPNGQGGGGVTTSDDGTNTFVWVVVAFAAMIIAGAGAWGVVRMRGRGRSAGPGPDA